jgi:CHAT domain-containing protein
MQNQFSFPRWCLMMWRMIRSTVTSFVTCAILLLWTCPVYAQVQASAQPNHVPPELQVSDPGVKRLLDQAEEYAKVRKYDEYRRALEEALEICTKQESVFDRGIVEDHFGVYYFVLGDLDAAQAHWHRSLADAEATSNSVLQADVLVALSSLEQATGRLDDTLKTLERALELSRKSKSLYLQARALGELGRVQATNRDTTSARKSLEEALAIDRVNGFAFEPEHLLYLGDLAVQENKKDEALELGIQARNLAIKNENYLVFIQASGFVSQGYIATGKPEDGIRLLEMSRDGLSRDGKPLFQSPEQYKRYTELPYIRITILESFALANESAGNTGEALKAWQELYKVASTSHFDLAKAGATKRLALLYAKAKDVSKAETFAAEAISLYSKAGDTKDEAEVLRAEAQFLNKEGQTAKAIAAEEQLVTLDKTSNNTPSRFLDDIIIAEFWGNHSPDAKVESALKDAETLIDLDGNGPPGIKAAVVTELYLRLADLAAGDGQGAQKIIDLEKAIPAAVKLSNAKDDEKNTKPLSYLVPQIKKDIEAYQVQQSAEVAYSKRDYKNALKLYEILSLSDETQAAWTGKYQEYMSSRDQDPTFVKLSKLPQEVIETKGGAEILAANVQEMGHIAEGVRLKIWGQLVSYYMSQGDFEHQVKYANLALPYLNIGEGKNPTPFDLAIECQLAVALLQAKDMNGAVVRAKGCLADSKKLGGADVLRNAHQVNLWVLESAERHDEAKESADFLLHQSTEDPNDLMKLGFAKSQQGDRTAAIQAWRNAITLFRHQKNLAAEADTSVVLSNVLEFSPTADLQERERLLKDAKGLYQQTGSTVGQLRATAYLGALYGAQGEPEKSHLAFNEALKLAGNLKDKELEALVFAEMGSASEALHNRDSAIDFYSKSAKLYAEQGKFADEVDQLRRLALALQSSNRSDEALQAALRATAEADKTNSYAPKYWARTILGSIYAETGSYEESIAALKGAKQISDEANQQLYSAWADLGLARDYSTIGAWKQALEHATAAVPILKQSNDRDTEYLAYTELMDLFASRESDIKDYVAALEYYDKAHQLILAIHPDRTASLNLDLVEILYGQKRYKEAIDKAREAVAYFASKQDDLDRTGALISLAEALRSDGQLNEAGEALKAAEVLCAKSTDVYMIGRLHYGLAGVSRAKGDLRTAAEQYKLVIDVIEKFKRDTNTVAQKDVAETYSFIYDDLIDTLFALSQTDASHAKDYAQEALEYTELNKARGFASAWGYAFLDGLRRKVPGQLQEQELALQAKRRQLRSSLATGTAASGRDLTHLRASLQEVDASQNELVRRLREASPAYAEIRYPQRLHTSRLDLHAGELLIETKVMTDTTLIWLVAGTEQGPVLKSSYSVPKTRQWFADRVFQIRDAFNSGHPERFNVKLTNELLEALFPSQALQLIRDARSIVIIPDDLFYLFPLEMLSDGGRFLLMDKPTEYFPSAATFDLSRRSLRNSPEASNAFIGIADPITSSDDPRYGDIKPLDSSSKADQHGVLNEPIDKMAARGYTLERIPGTAKEIKEIASLLSATKAETKILEGTDATKEKLLRTDLSRYRFVHFATHGILPVESGISEPALVLSYDGKSKDDMLLSLSDILQLRLRADVVVLSACNTGSGKVTRAEGVGSLGLAFLAAGSSSVIVSLWQVGDESTAVLMKEFYRNLLQGKPKAVALADARSFVYAQGYTEPFFWAPFILTGE